jgi:hypothetical protein
VSLYDVSNNVYRCLRGADLANTDYSLSSGCLTMVCQLYQVAELVSESLTCFGMVTKAKNISALGLPKAGSYFSHGGRFLSRFVLSTSWDVVLDKIRRPKGEWRRVYWMRRDKRFRFGIGSIIHSFQCAAISDILVRTPRSRILFHSWSVRFLLLSIVTIRASNTLDPGYEEDLIFP